MSACSHKLLASMVPHRGCLAALAPAAGAIQLSHAKLVSCRKLSGKVMRRHSISQPEFSLSGAISSRPSCRSFASSRDPHQERDLYKLLGVGKNASADEIKAAYRKEALKWHPDRQPPEKRKEAEQHFSALSNAYEMLSDPAKRQQYDFGGGTTSEPHGFSRSGNVHSQEAAERMFREAFGGASFAQIFGQLMGQNGMFGGGAPLRVGTEVTVSSNLRDIVSECRMHNIDSTNDAKRKLSLGRRGKVIKVDPKDQTIKVNVDGVGAVWFGPRAVQPLMQSAPMGGRDPFSGVFPGMSGIGGFGNFGGHGSNVVQIKQERVRNPDGSVSLRVSRVVRNPDGTLQESTMDVKEG